MLLNLRQLEIFRAVMVTKTVSGAATLLHVSQPGISRSLKHIEQRLQITLFERRKGRLVATREAQELFQELTPIYERLERLEWTLERITEGDKKRVRIGCPPSLVRHVLPRALAMTRSTMPELLVRVDALSNEEIAGYLAEQKIAFALSYYDPDHPLITAEPVLTGEMVCVVPRDHRLAQHEAIEAGDLDNENMVLFHSDTALGHAAFELFKEQGIRPVPSVLVRYNDHACAMVEQGVGIALVSSFVTAENVYPKLKVIPLRQPVPLSVFILRHSQEPLTHMARAFLNHFTTAVHRVGEELGNVD